MATDLELTQVLAFLAAAYPRFELTKETAEVYRLALSDLTFDELRSAAASVVKEREFFPTVAEIRRRIPAPPIPRMNDTALLTEPEDTERAAYVRALVVEFEVKHRMPNA